MELEQRFGYGLEELAQHLLQTDGGALSPPLHDQHHEMEQQPSDREDCVRKVLEAYRNTSGTCGHLLRPDRMLAVQRYQRGVPSHTVENAFVLASVRRLIRPADVPPLTTVRSLAYFLPVIEEVLDMEVGEDYFQYARQKLQRLRSS
jgi:hypothetical protein